MKDIRMIPILLCVLAAHGLFSVHMNAAQGAQEAPAEAARLRFGPPDVYEVGPQSAYLLAGDLNGDGLMDLICADNRKSLLYLLIQEEDGPRRFKIVEESAATAIGSLAVGDLNGDGLDDLALGGTEAFVRLQTDHGTFADGQKLEESGQHVLIADLDGNGRQDLLLLSDRETHIFRQNESGALDRPELLMRAFPLAWKPMLFDLNGDGRLDLAYRDAETPDSLIVGYQNASGRFGAEIALNAGLVFYVSGSSKIGERGGGGVVATENNTQALKIMRPIVPEPVGDDDASFSLMRMLPYANEKGPANARHSLGLAALDPEAPPALVALGEQRAAIDFLRADSEGDFLRDSRPALLGARKLRLTHDGDASLAWVLSREEGAIGVAAIENGRMGFPQPLDIGARPLAFDLADMDGSGRADLAYVTVIDGRALLRIDCDPAPGAPIPPARIEVDLQEVGGKAFQDFEAEDLLAGDFNNDGRCDVAIFPRYGSMQVLLQTEDGGFEPLFTDEGVKKGMFEGLDANQFLAVDFFGDGRIELLTARSTFVRILSLTAEGEVEALGQLNGKSGASRIAAVAAGDVDGDGVLEALMLDRGERNVTVYRRTGDGDFEAMKHIDLKTFVGQSLLAADLNGDGRDDIIVGGADKLGVIFSGRPDAELQAVATRRTEVVDGGYRLAEAGEIAPGAGDEIVILENKEHLLKFFQLDAEDALREIYKFKVFGGEGERAFFNPNAPQPPEPREAIFPDLNGDDRADLAVLVHNKVIAYPQIDPDAPGEEVIEAAPIDEEAAPGSDD